MVAGLNSEFRTVFVWLSRIAASTMANKSGSPHFEPQAGHESAIKTYRKSAVEINVSRRDAESQREKILISTYLSLVKISVPPKVLSPPLRLRISARDFPTHITYIEIDCI